MISRGRLPAHDLPPDVAIRPGLRNLPAKKLSDGVELWGYRGGTEWMVGHYPFPK